MAKSDNELYGPMSKKFSDFSSAIQSYTKKKESWESKHKNGPSYGEHLEELRHQETPESRKARTGK